MRLRLVQVAEAAEQRVALDRARARAPAPATPGAGSGAIGPRVARSRARAARRSASGRSRRSRARAPRRRAGSPRAASPRAAAACCRARRRRAAGRRARRRAPSRRGSRRRRRARSVSPTTRWCSTKSWRTTTPGRAAQRLDDPAVRLGVVADVVERDVGAAGAPEAARAARRDVDPLLAARAGAAPSSRRCPTGTAASASSRRPSCGQ